MSTYRWNFVTDDGQTREVPFDVVIIKSDGSYEFRWTAMTGASGATFVHATVTVREPSAELIRTVDQLVRPSDVLHGDGPHPDRSPDETTTGVGDPLASR